jgi:hypothetical protein
MRSPPCCFLWDASNVLRRLYFKIQHDATGRRVITGRGLSAENSGKKSRAKADDRPKQHVLDPRMLPAPHQPVIARNRVRGDDEDGGGNQRRHAGIETCDQTERSDDFHHRSEDDEETRRPKAYFVKEDRGTIDVAELGNGMREEEKSAGHANGSSRVDCQIGKKDAHEF